MNDITSLSLLKPVIFFIPRFSGKTPFNLQFDNDYFTTPIEQNTNFINRT
jgi:hypothetical protein